MVVNKSALFLRDNEGNLLPMEKESELFKGTVKILPLTEGDFNKLRTEGDKASDEKIICDFLLEPKLTEEEVKTMPLVCKRELIKLILMTSGMTREEVDAALKKGIELMQNRIKNV